MDIAVTIKDIILFLLGAGGIVLIIYLIILFANLIKTVKGANEVLEDVAEITDIAAKRTEDIDAIITNLASSAKTVSSNLKGNKNIIATLSSAVGLASSIKGLFKKGKDEEDDEDEEEE
jgi:uncharacterized protein YoxC